MHQFAWDGSGWDEESKEKRSSLGWPTMRQKLSWVITFSPRHSVYDSSLCGMATCVTAICLIRWFSRNVSVYLAFTQHPFYLFIYFFWQLSVSDLLLNGESTHSKWPSGIQRYRTGYRTWYLYTEQDTLVHLDTTYHFHLMMWESICHTAAWTVGF